MKKYFFGHYFKLQSNTETIALIPSYSRIGKNYYAYLQIITKDKSYVEDFNYSEYKRGKGFNVQIGNNIFNEDGIKLNINGDVKLSGNIDFVELNKLKGSIMGPFNYIPFMECKHMVKSIKHRINGKLYLNDKEYNFDDSYCYIEGDKGRSFPKEYTWTHALFNNGSIMFSIAKIPFGLFNFTGIIGFINYNGKTKKFGTYNFTKVIKLTEEEIIIKKGKYKLYINLIKENDYPLKAPTLGKMDRIIKESAECIIKYKYTFKDKIIFDETVNNASFEYEYK